MQSHKRRIRKKFRSNHQTRAKNRRPRRAPAKCQAPTQKTSAAARAPNTKKEPTASAKFSDAAGPHLKL